MKYIYIYIYIYICIYLCIYIYNQFPASNCMVEENRVIQIEQYYTHYIFTENEQNLITQKIYKSVTFNEFISE